MSGLAEVLLTGAAEKKHLVDAAVGLVDHETHEDHKFHVAGLPTPLEEKLHNQHLYRAVKRAGYLEQDDPVGISFWIISIAMVATTYFLTMEAFALKPQWKTSMHCGALVTLVAAVHYWYMREFWVTFSTSPIVYRYIDWSITVPLQMIEFYLILSAVMPSLGGAMFWRLMLGTVAMLACGYMGETHTLSPLVGFVLGCSGWAYILNEIFVGEASKAAAAADKSNRYVKQAYVSMRFIVSVGWSIYPLGYFFGYLCHSVDQNSLNAVYNLADFVNKIAFCLCIWHAGKQDTMAGMGH